MEDLIPSPAVETLRGRAKGRKINKCGNSVLRWHFPQCRGFPSFSRTVSIFFDFREFPAMFSSHLSNPQALKGQMAAHRNGCPSPVVLANSAPANPYTCAGERSILQTKIFAVHPRVSRVFPNRVHAWLFSFATVLLQR